MQAAVFKEFASFVINYVQKNTTVEDNSNMENVALRQLIVNTLANPSISEDFKSILKEGLKTQYKKESWDETYVILTRGDISAEIDNVPQNDIDIDEENA